MKRSAPIPGVRFTALCSGCGIPFSGTGALGNHGRYSKTCTPEMRFWGKVKKTASCWLWQGAANTTGYGMVSWAGRKNIVAHRLAWKLLRGEIPAGMNALHKCDTPRCCNPDHIFFGTQKDNAADCMAKDRHARGERNKKNKLTDEQVLQIRRDYRRPTFKVSNIQELVKRYGVRRGTISAIIRGQTWRHLK